MRTGINLLFQVTVIFGDDCNCHKQIKFFVRKYHQICSSEIKIFDFWWHFHYVGENVFIFNNRWFGHVENQKSLFVMLKCGPILVTNNRGFFEKFFIRKVETKIFETSPNVKGSHDKNSPFSVEMDFCKKFQFPNSTAKLRRKCSSGQKWRKFGVILWNEC